jgi:anaerobic selenocysteine-containing dehydrogenase
LYGHPISGGTVTAKRFSWGETIERFYHLFVDSPRLAYHSRTGVGQHINATMTERAIARLSAMTGANGS